MSTLPEGDPLPRSTAYDEAKHIWMYMLTDDDGYRDICDRDGYFMEAMASKYPDLPHREIDLLRSLAYDSMIDYFRTH